MTTTIETDFTGIRDLWAGLAPGTRNIFSSWEFAELWWRHFGTGRRPRPAVVRVGREAVAVLPLYEQRIAGIPTMRFIGGGVADELGPVCAPEHRGPAARALGELLDRRGALLLAETVPPEWGSLLGARAVKLEPSPVIAIGGQSWDSLRTTFSPNLRSKLGRAERRLERERGLRYRLVTDRSELGPAFAALVALHRARWGTATTAFSGGRERWHHEFAELALDRGWLRLWTAELDGRVAAAWLGYAYAGVESFYQAGRDPAFDSTSIGLVLLAHTIRAACAEGRDEYRLLRGGEAYKSRFATGDRPVATLLRPANAGQRLLVGVAGRMAARSRVRALAKRVL